MISVIAVSIYTLMDKIMIEWMTSTTEVGYYENTEKIVAIANNVAGAVGAVMLPRVSNLRASGNDDKVLSYIGKSMKYIMLIAVALAFGIAGVSKSFSIVYYGKEFEKCGILLMVISPAIVFSCGIQCTQKSVSFTKRHGSGFCYGDSCSIGFEFRAECYFYTYVWGVRSCDWNGWSAAW